MLTKNTAYKISLIILLMLPAITSAQTNIEAAQSYYDNGDTKQALISYYRELSINPNSVTALVGVAMCHMRNGHNEMAQESISKAIKIDVNDISSLYQQAKLQSLRKEYSSAKDTLERLISLDSEHLGAYQLLSDTLYRLGDPEGADQAYETLKSKQAAH